ncbi:hypothetical protein [Pseudomonas abietaniphila]|uniref:hypothetical protein n=1 Tax=Pseudomonas abietaniphila TaxID=89065 RepID=UPI001428AE38|nr:hypothetical protein [Pseudomonas abietaniphila]
MTDDDTPMQEHGDRRILYAMATDETPGVLLSIKPGSISFRENTTTFLRIFKRGV